MLKKYKYILKEKGITGKKMSKMIGMEYGSYRFSTRTSATVVPKWVTSFVIGYELTNKNEE